MIYPAVYGGDFTEERTILLCAVPQESPTGTMLRTLWVLADPLAGDPTAYWLLTVGRFGVGDFEAMRMLPFPGGFPTGVQRVDLSPEIHVERGDLLAVRVTPTGDCEPLTGLGLTPEFGLAGARVR